MLPNPYLPVCVLLFGLFGLASGADAGEPPALPMLRIDIGLHHQSVNAIVADGDEKIFVTSSADKTLKVWSAETGDLIRTLRLPIGPGSEGEAYSVAISPDGETLAAAAGPDRGTGLSPSTSSRRQAGAWCDTWPVCPSGCQSDVFPGTAPMSRPS